MTPFYFQVRGMQARDAENYRTENGNGWKPPKALGKNVPVDNVQGTPDPIFYCDGTTTKPTDRMPEDGLRYKTASLYFNDTHIIWAVSYDATTRQVHDGDDNDPCDSEAGSDTESAADDNYCHCPSLGPTPESTAPNPLDPDWAQISFRRASFGPNNALSYLTCDAPYPQILHHRVSQRWAEQLLPDRYYKPNGDRDPEACPDSGGLVGELPLLLGLLALASPKRTLAETFTTSVRRPPWALPTTPQGRGYGWASKRGVVATVWRSNANTSRAELEAYERGDRGRIFE